ncbi:hypothetical protein SISNIDRAFT_326680 [Sistotremastrum niveocremeum HHB9708]|uniref:Uncharacterized protein n=1 Tax=Sistotremastrum niveocremeum HHB9708 TaxID=1314777 RepID=A0A164XB57_9AGAM|nr:hypothetical protein SISNIDRAFT_326680 [Sistotremastrum niveocremeum HHB9708]
MFPATLFLAVRIGSVFGSQKRSYDPISESQLCFSPLFAKIRAVPLPRFDRPIWRNPMTPTYKARASRRLSRQARDRHILRLEHLARFSLSYLALSLVRWLHHLRASNPISAFDRLVV